MPTRPGSLGKRPRTPTFSRCPPPVAVLVVFLNPLAPRLIGSLLLFQLGKKFKTKLMPWGPALRAAQHPAYPARPAPGQPARSREASRARRPTDCTTKRGGRAGCSSLPVYSAARVTEILPTPAFFFGLGAQSKGQQRPDQREPLQPPLFLQQLIQVLTCVPYLTCLKMKLIMSPKFPSDVASLMA